MIVTLAMRRAEDVERKSFAAQSTFAALSKYASERDGHFVVFGSFARGDFGPDSDLDVLVQFPVEAERDARDAVEEICRRFGLVPDIVLAADASESLMTRVRRDGRSLPAS